MSALAQTSCGKIDRYYREEQKNSFLSSFAVVLLDRQLPRCTRADTMLAPLKEPNLAKR